MDNFILTLSISVGVSLVLILLTVISVARKKDSLTGFEKGMMISVVVGLCTLLIALYIISNKEYFFALFR